MSDRVGQQLGNYQLLHLIGRGNFTDVYLGEHLHLDTRAAIKVLNSRLTSGESEKLRSEARMMARLTHPHIIRVLEFGIEDGVPFLIMEYAPNGTLRQSHPKSTKVPIDLVVSYVKQVADALQYIHTQKLIHRDVKPESMLLGSNNEVLLAEFGIAIIAQSTRSQQTQQTQEAAESVVYMAPEQLMGKPRPASDQYALAVMTYEWLCGDPPFTGSVQQIASQHLSANPPPLRTKMPEISPTVEQVVMKALDKDPKQRFVHVVDFALALEEAFDAETAGRILFVPTSGRSAEREQRTFAPRNLPTGTVTLLFTDIEESTHLLEQLGDHYDNLLVEYREVLQASFREWNGYEVESWGDGFSVAFARATDAVVAVVEVQRALTSHPWPGGVAVRVRMGLHTGEPTLTSEGYVGLDVHRAERIMRAGHGGQVLLSQTTAHLVEQDLPDDVNLHDLGEYRLKDLGRPKRLFQLVIAGLPADFPPLKTLDSCHHNLPVQLTPFIGREQEVIAVCDLLRCKDVHLLALTGPGGTGKTRLALQVAAEVSDIFDDGIFFVNLAPIGDPALVLSTIAETLGFRERADKSFLGGLKEHLRQKQMLLLLDNFEQVVSAAEKVVELLVACPQLKVMVTSREVPHVRAKYEFTVPPLPLPDLKHLPDLATLSHFAAVDLFISRAQAVKPDFQMTATNAHALAEICARLDGLPLAIELAAARVKLLPPQALLRRMGQRLEMLTSTSTDVPARQLTLRNTLAWSYELLTEEEQRLFRRLSVFVGGCTLDAIEAVYAALNEADNLFEGVVSLIDKSLLQQTEQDAEEPRLIMLETIREYGLERLRAGGEMEVTHQAQAAYYLRLLEEADQEFQGPQQLVWLKRLEQEHENLRAVMEWSLEQEKAEQRKEMALRLGIALKGFWYVHGSYSEGRAFLEQALAGSEKIAPSVRAKALDASGEMVSILGDQDRAQVLHDESLALFQSLGDTAGIARSLQGLGWVARDRGNYSEARRLSEEVLALWREVGDTERVASTLRLLGVLHDFQGEPEKARTLYEESLVLSRQLGNKSGIADSLRMLAQGLFYSQGDPMAVRSQLEEGLALYRETGGKSGIAICLSLIAQVTLSQGDVATANRLAEESVALYRETGDQLGMAFSLSVLAEVEATHGNYERARSLYEESLTIARNTGDKGGIAFYQEEFASVIAAQGELTWAACLWGSAEVLREDIGATRSPFERVSYERAVASASTLLGEKSFATAWAHGRSMTPGQALAAQTPEVKLTPGESSSTLPAAFIPTYPNGLTAREMEVLRLLAQGLTSAQIAEQLVLSVLTVNTHVRSIYSKLGVSSRSAATRWAIEHHLV
jgi:predicted ATPase/serine/threonine protein kinase/DNA-binding CsgD family transcriptional regulator